MHQLDKVKQTLSKIHIQLNLQTHTHTTLTLCFYPLMNGSTVKWAVQGVIMQVTAHREYNEPAFRKQMRKEGAGHVLEVTLQWRMQDAGGLAGSGLFAGMAAVICLFPPVCRDGTPGRSRRKMEINFAACCQVLILNTGDIMERDVWRNKKKNNNNHKTVECKWEYGHFGEQKNGILNVWSVWAVHLRSHWNESLMGLKHDPILQDKAGVILHYCYHQQNPRGD